jgi:hypothetical protein
MDRLHETHPHVYKELHPVLNSGVDVSKIAPGSSGKLWWQCAQHKDHVWDDSPYSRTRRGAGCLVCSNKRVLAGFNDLQTKNPSLASQWHPTKNGDLLPSAVFPSSNKKAWWICPTNAQHEWRESPHNQAKSIRGCPFCSNKRILAGDNDLESLFPQVASKWDYEKNGTLKPSQVSIGTPRSVFWLCDLGHSFSSPVVNMRRKGAGCPYCSSKALLEGFNDLASTHPELLILYSPNNLIAPTQIMAGSDVRLKWICEANHEWISQVKNVKKGDRCPVCSSKKLEQGFNDLASKYPKLALQWHPTKNGELKPSQVVGGGKKIIWWLCDFGHEWPATIGNRVYFDSGCPVCQNIRLQIGSNDMETTHPDLSAQFDLEKNLPNTPQSLIASTHKMLWWKCELEHSWRATGNSRVSQSSGCPICSGRKVLASFNDLETRYPALSLEWHPNLNGDVKPHQVSGGTPRKVWWLCGSGHSYAASVVQRASLKSGCPICSNQKALGGYNDLASQWPSLLAEWDYLKNAPTNPQDVVARSDKKRWWSCSEGHSWKTAPGVRIAKGTGCPTCANRGFSQAASGTFYFIQNTALGSRKVGIANQKSMRLESWRSLGWDVIYRFDSEDGGLVLSLETNILRWIRRDLGYPPHLTQTEMAKLGGWSETFSDDGISNYELILRIQEELIILQALRE